VSRKTGPTFPTIGLDYIYGYKSSFSLNHKLNHYDRRTRLIGRTAGRSPLGARA
jgi:hypothetical protein